MKVKYSRSTTPNIQVSRRRRERDSNVVSKSMRNIGHIMTSHPVEVAVAPKTGNLRWRRWALHGQNCPTSQMKVSRQKV